MNNNIFTTIGAVGHSQEERAQHDYYATDPTTIDSLFANEVFSDDIWEPACGGGHLSRKMQEMGKNVRETDIIDRIGNKTLDFLSCNEKWHGDIITNPPYKYAKEFVEKSLDVIQDGNKVAMLLKLTFLEGKKRHEMFKKYPPKTIYVFTSRINCAKNGDFERYHVNSAICYAWFVWVKGNKDYPTIKWI